MASIETPPQIEPKKTPSTENGAGRPGRPEPSDREELSAEEFHFLISELRDENSRSRMREAIWISIIVHLVVLFIMKESPRLWPASPVTLITPAEMVNNQQLTYLDQKPDTQRVPKVESNKLSDKNRIAEARNPQLKRLLDELRDNRRTGAPGQQAQGAPNPQQAPPMQQQAPPQSAPPRINESAAATPQQPNPFSQYSSPTASSAIQEATRSAAAARGRGQLGEYGNGMGVPDTNNKGMVDILSDTQGVDFSAYLQRVLQSVKLNWYSIIPEVARPPLLKQGKVTIDFVINKNGGVEEMRLFSPSGDVSLDRAAWGGITASNPFPPLPTEFHGEYIRLRFRFYYNPDRGVELR